MMAATSSYGFTEADRETLITCKVTVLHLSEKIGGLNNRIDRLEDERVTHDDMVSLQTQIDSLRKQVIMIQEWRWKVIGAAGAIGTASAAVFTALVHFFLR